MSNSWL